jgi:hypothetical protein
MTVRVTQEWLDARLKTGHKIVGGTLGKPKRGPSLLPVKWKAGWHEIGGKKIYMRSQWEYSYALYLESLRQCGHVLWWKYESTVFWFAGIKRGTNSYKPDFEVMTGTGQIEFHEVKGWMDAKSATKIKRMKKYHPDVTLKVIDKTWFKANAATVYMLRQSAKILAR